MSGLRPAFVVELRRFGGRGELGNSCDGVNGCIGTLIPKICFRRTGLCRIGSSCRRHWCRILGLTLLPFLGLDSAQALPRNCRRYKQDIESVNRYQFSEEEIKGMGIVLRLFRYMQMT